MSKESNKSIYNQIIDYIGYDNFKLAIDKIVELYQSGPMGQLYVTTRHSYDDTWYYSDVGSTLSKGEEDLTTLKMIGERERERLEPIRELIEPIGDQRIFYTLAHYICNPEHINKNIHTALRLLKLDENKLEYVFEVLWHLFPERRHELFNSRFEHIGITNFLETIEEYNNSTVKIKDMMDRLDRIYDYLSPFMLKGVDAAFHVSTTDFIGNVNNQSKRLALPERIENDVNHLARWAQREQPNVARLCGLDIVSTKGKNKISLIRVNQLNKIRPGILLIYGD